MVTCRRRLRVDLLGRACHRFVLCRQSIERFDDKRNVVGESLTIRKSFVYAKQNRANLTPSIFRLW
jgi:hypothetical protein